MTHVSYMGRMKTPRVSPLIDHHTAADVSFR
jgi:hypothetical protein